MPPKCLPGSINNTLLPDCRAAYAAITPADVPPYTHTSTDFDTFPSKRKGSNRATDAVSQPNNRTPIRLMRYFLSIYRLSAGFSSARRQYKVGKKTERGNNSPTARDFSPRNGTDTVFRRNPTPTYVADKNKRTHGTNRKTAGKQEAEDMTVSPALLEFNTRVYSSLSASFILWNTLVTSSSSSNFSINFSIDSRCSGVTSFVSSGMRSNSPLIRL